MAGKALYTVNEAAGLCSTTPKSLRHWVKVGEETDGAEGVPPTAVHRIGSRIRIKGWWLRQFTDAPGGES